MVAVLVLDLGDAAEVEVVTTIRRRIEQTESGPGLARLERAVIDTDGETLADVIPLSSRRAG